jgi:glycine dehydrogenase
MSQAAATQSEFVRRHVGPDASEIERMLAAIGSPGLDALIDETVPEGIRRRNLGRRRNPPPCRHRHDV